MTRLSSEELDEVEAAASRGETIGPTLIKALVAEVRRLRSRVDGNGEPLGVAPRQESRMNGWW